MAFQLDSVVPWGRSFEEYCQMFCLSGNDLSGKIAGFGDGPSSFNCEASKNGYSITSFDPIYQFTREQLATRIEEVRRIVMKQTEENSENYVWTKIRSINELERLRMSAMELFLTDYEKGKKENRYIFHELPNRLDYEENSFDIGLSSHFLLMYTDLGYDFHISAIYEMLRVCGEIRIFPIIDLNADKSDLTANVIKHFKQNYTVKIVKTDYEFQKGGNKMLIIKKLYPSKDQTNKSVLN